MNRLFSRISGYALVLIFPALPFSQARFSVFGFPVYVLEVITLCSLLMFVIALLRGERRLYRVRYPYIFGWGLIVSGIFLSSIFSSGITVEELGAVKSWVIFPALAGFLFVQLFDTVPRITYIFVTWFMSISCFAVAVFLPGPFSIMTYDGRLTSVYPSPNQCSMYVVPGILIGWYFFLRKGNTKLLLPLIIAQGLIFSVLIRTGSQGAMLAAGLATAAFFLGSLSGKRAVLRLFSATLAIFLFLGAVAVFSGEWTRLSSGEIRSPIASRVMIWNAAIGMLTEHPIVGIGPRNFQSGYLAMQSEFPPYLEWAVPHPHDVLLSFWLSGGLFGLFGFLLLVISTSVSLMDGMSKDDVSGRMLAALLFALVSAFLIHGLVDDTYFRNDLSMMFWSVLALSAGVFPDAKKTATGIAVL